MIKIYYKNNNLKSLESVVNEELRKVCEWLNTNKLSLNTSKSNFVVFQGKPDHNVTIKNVPHRLYFVKNMQRGCHHCQA